MISRNILTDVLFIVILVILQVFLLNRILIMGKYPPILYPIYVMFYPFYRDKYQFLGTSFLLGLGMDMFLGTWGINAFATTLMAFVRTVIFRSSSDSTSDFFSFESLQWTQFLGFILTNLFLHQFLVQFIEYFKLSRALEVLINISITIVYSFVFVLFYVLIFKIKQRV